jgi:hypothetical protein
MMHWLNGQCERYEPHHDAQQACGCPHSRFSWGFEKTHSTLISVDEHRLKETFMYINPYLHGSPLFKVH